MTHGDEDLGLPDVRDDDAEVGQVGLAALHLGGGAVGGGGGLGGRGLPDVVAEGDGLELQEAGNVVEDGVHLKKGIFTEILNYIFLLERRIEMKRSLLV